MFSMNKSEVCTIHIIFSDFQGPSAVVMMLELNAIVLYINFKITKRMSQ